MVIPFFVGPVNWLTWRVLGWGGGRAGPLQLGPCLQDGLHFEVSGPQSFTLLPTNSEKHPNRNLTFEIKTLRVLAIVCKPEKTANDWGKE